MFREPGGHQRSRARERNSFDVHHLHVTFYLSRVFSPLFHVKGCVAVGGWRPVHAVEGGEQAAEEAAEVHRRPHWRLVHRVLPAPGHPFQGRYHRSDAAPASHSATCAVLSVKLAQSAICFSGNVQELADFIGLPCRIAQGCKYCSAPHRSSCLVKIDSERRYVRSVLVPALCHVVYRYNVA